jgi:hypothetical protein
VIRVGSFGSWPVKTRLRSERFRCSASSLNTLFLSASLDWMFPKGRAHTGTSNEYGAAETVLAAVGQLTLVTLRTTLAAPLRKEVQCPQSGFVPAGGPGPLVRPGLEWGGHVDHNHERAPIWESSDEHKGLSK